MILENVVSLAVFYSTLHTVTGGHWEEMAAAVSEAVPPPLLEARSAHRLAKGNMSLESEGATPLMYACQQAREADLKAIMSKKVSINSKGY